MFSENKNPYHQPGRYVPTKNAIPQEHSGGGMNGNNKSAAGNSQEKFWKMVNAASNALFKVADVQNPNDVNEVAVKLLGLFQNIRGEYMKRRGLEETRKQSIREIQSNPLNVAPIFNRSNIPIPPPMTLSQSPAPALAAPSPATPAPAAPIPPILLPMKQEDVKNMSQEQAQALLGNLLTQLMKEQQQGGRR